MGSPDPPQKTENGVIFFVGWGTENGLRIPVNRSEKIRASYVAIASVGENPRPQLDATSPVESRALRSLETELMVWSPKNLSDDLRGTLDKRRP